MGFLEELQGHATELLDAVKDKALEQIEGQQTPLPQNVVAPLPVTQTTALSSINSSTMTMVLGALAIGAIAIFALKKVKA